MDTSAPPTTTVKSSLINIYNKELIGKNQAIFEAFSITTQDPDLVYAMEKLSEVWSLNLRGIVYVYGVAMGPKYQYQSFKLHITLWLFLC